MSLEQLFKELDLLPSEIDFDLNIILGIAFVTVTKQNEKRNFWGISYQKMMSKITKWIST